MASSIGRKPDPYREQLISLLELLGFKQARHTPAPPLSYNKIAQGAGQYNIKGTVVSVHEYKRVGVQVYTRKASVDVRRVAKLYDSKTPALRHEFTPKGDLDRFQCVGQIAQVYKHLCASGVIEWLNDAGCYREASDE